MRALVCDLSNYCESLVYILCFIHLNVLSCLKERTFEVVNVRIGSVVLDKYFILES